MLRRALGGGSAPAARCAAAECGADVPARARPAAQWRGEGRRPASVTCRASGLCVQRRAVRPASRQRRRSRATTARPRPASPSAFTPRKRPHRQRREAQQHAEPPPRHDVLARPPGARSRTSRAAPPPRARHWRACARSASAPVQTNRDSSHAQRDHEDGLRHGELAATPAQRPHRRGCAAVIAAAWRP